jgi:quinol monooxygenase YgiN
MAPEVSWWVELAIKPGRLGAFEQLTGEMVRSTRDETGVLSYQRFVTDDGRFVHVYERYADSATASAHLRAFAANFGERYAALVERRRFTVFGDPSDELRRLLDRYGPTYLKPFGPWPYWA